MRQQTGHQTQQKEGSAVSEHNDTQPRDVTREAVRHVTPSPHRCGHVGTTTAMRDLERLRAVYNPAYLTVHGLPVDPMATLFLENASVSLSPEVWRAVIDALLEVLPPRADESQMVRANCAGIASEAWEQTHD